MKKLLLTTALSFAIIAPSMAEDIPYSRQRSVEAADVATLAPSSGEEKVPAKTAQAEDSAQAVLDTPTASEVKAGETTTVTTTTTTFVPAPPQASALPPAVATSSTAWDYSAYPTGPAGWGTMNPEFAACKTGVKQSPVNISTFYQEALPDIEPRYGMVPLSVMNIDHTLKFNYAEGSGFVVDGMGYRLKEFDFHTPSEHYVDGAPYPMEVHFVHMAQDGSLAVIAVMIKAGAHNKFIEALWQNAPAVNGARRTISDVRLSAADLMPKALDYYRYDGSLTTPPCTEGVLWFVLKEPIEASEDQIKAFQKLFPSNARPVQALGERVITGD